MHAGAHLLGFVSLVVYVLWLALVESYRGLPAYFAGTGAVAFVWVVSVRWTLKALGKFEAEWLQAAGIAGCTMIPAGLACFGLYWAVETLKSRGWRPLLDPMELYWGFPALALMFFALAADQIRRHLTLTLARGFGLALIGTLTGMVCMTLVIRIGRRIIEGR